MCLYFSEKRFVKFALLVKCIMAAHALIENIVEKHHYLVSHIKRSVQTPEMNKISCCKVNTDWGFIYH